MHALVALLLTTFALAGPVPVSNVKRQATGITAHEFTEGGCRDVIFIFSRGSTEIGNMGTVIGPPLSDGLKLALGNSAVATEGVDYAALLTTNFLPGGADPAGIAKMVSLLESAASKCPNAKILAGGYSQGAAMTHRAIEQLSSSTLSRITGVTLFGDTQFLQTGGKVGKLPASKVKIYCAPGDLVCLGTLTITAAHLSYGIDAGDASAFLVSRVKAA